LSVLEFRVAREFDVVTIRLSKEVQLHLDRCEADDLCPCCGQKLYERGIERPKRGCHVSCANSLYHLIDIGATDEDGNTITDQLLIKQGKWRAPQTGGRKSTNPAIIALRGKQNAR
jgi:hypothetical protein